LTFVEQTETLIKYWLHEQPEDNFADFLKQSAKACWIEERYFKTMSHVFGNREK